MQIEKESTNSFKVCFNRQELCEFHLTYQQLDYKNQKTKEFLHHVFTHAVHMLGGSPCGEQLVIEVFPAPQGGCEIYFTKRAKKGKRYRQKHPHIFAFDTCEQLFQGAHILGEHPPQSEVYLLEEQYILILQEAPVHGLREFGKPVPASKQTLAHIREHGHLLARPRAVEQLQGSGL